MGTSGKSLSFCDTLEPFFFFKEVVDLSHLVSYYD